MEIGPLKYREMGKLLTKSTREMEIGRNGP
jgi:hypothetical protein